MILWRLISSLWWPETGRGYALGSSWAGDTGMFAVFGLLYVHWKRHNCHVERCPRIGRLIVETEGHHDLYCSKHAPRRRPQ
jgi:hypothetical protein